MSDGLLPLSPASPGGQIEDVEDLIGVGATPVVRQRVQITGAILAEIARILNVNPSAGDYGLVTRNIPSGTQDVSVVPDTASTVTSAGQAVGTSPVLLFAANPSRKSVTLSNTGPTSLYVGFTSAVSAAVGVNQGILVVAAGGTFSDGGEGRWLGDLWAVSDLAGGSIAGYEFSP